MRASVLRVAALILFFGPLAVLAQPALILEGRSSHAEVATSDSTGERRLWGRGRPNIRVYTHEDGTGDLCQKGGTTFGLSRHAVDWGSAAEACPAGTWVCRHDDVASCDTDRPDSEVDRMECDGTEVDLPAGEHHGWLAGASTGQKMFGLSKKEHEIGIFTTKTCESLPVWCCRETSPAPDADSAAIGTAELTVAGEIRTLRTAVDAPRLWGRGRPRTAVHGLDTSAASYCTHGSFVSLGLSRLAVDWGSAAAACPMGTWVCPAWRLGPCDTDRPDEGGDTLDYLDCAGAPASWPASLHKGWTTYAYQAEGSTDSGVAVEEATGDEVPLPTCNTLPVWCCWYNQTTPGTGPAALTVEGEARTVDSGGFPRTWGRGRGYTKVYDLEFNVGRCTHEGIRFGLSHTPVDWGSVADACPIGTWVCRHHEMEPCDTNRPDTARDALTCNGSALNLGPSHHAGWVSDASYATEFKGRYKFEDENVIYTTKTCTSLPTWCCWEE